MNNPSYYLESLIREFSRLPGIGQKSASRLAFHVLGMPESDVERLAAALVEIKKKIRKCAICGGISDHDVCSICSDEAREKDLVCVVEEPMDILIIEKTGKYRGVYHALNGLISPLDGIGPDELNIAPLVGRCRGGIREIILALNPRIEGDATALYLAKLLKPLGMKITRIAHGLPVGSELEYADSATIIKSIENRVEM